MCTYFSVHISEFTCVVWDNAEGNSTVGSGALNNNSYPGVPRWIRESCRAAKPWAVHCYWALLQRSWAKPEDQETVSHLRSLLWWTASHRNQKGRGKLRNIQSKSKRTKYTHLRSSDWCKKKCAKTGNKTCTSYLRRAGLSGAAVCVRNMPFCKTGVSTALLTDNWGWKK